MRLLLVATLSLLAFSTSACSRTPDDASPVGTTRLFVSAMGRSVEDRHGREEAYRLLSEASRAALVQRARETAALGARERDPWEVLVEGTAHLRFEPRPGGYHEQLDASDPDHAN